MNGLTSNPTSVQYLLDTNIIIYWLKGNQAIENRVLAVGLENIGYTIITQAELYFGAYNSGRIDNNLKNIHLISSKLATISFNNEAAQQFGRIKADLKQKGQLILDADLMIAAIALANNLTLVSNNTKHFSRIPNLRLDDWYQLED
jgi:tRNA(fMet)-specific endonuclease VapC